MSNNNPLSVSELNDIIKSVFSQQLGNVISVEGEICNLKKNNGNLYFSLKDDISNINVVHWRYSGNYDNGDKVIINGKITFYAKGGTYQITANNITKSGEGDINAKYQKMKDEFNNKGYFSKKREFPKKINNVGVITSLEGAALQDILYVLNTYNFSGNVYIKNCLAQGQNCPKSVKDGIEYFNEFNKTTKLDVLIIARGGGSIEDLIGYSSEEVVRAIYETDIFTISAIGHEIDNMLSDFAADCRAPTPSISAELLIKNKKEEKDNILKKMEKVKELKFNIISKIQNYESQIFKLQNICDLKNPLNIMEKEVDKYEIIKKKIREKILFNLKDNLYEIDKLKMKNNNYNVKKNMKAGYAIIVDENGNLISSKRDFEEKKQNNKIKIMFEDGEVFL
jgi:exodeoxyribonuclease VII large subunit